MDTPAQIIDAKGGPTAFATAIGAEPASVRMMKHRDKIPRSVWPEVMLAFEDVTLAMLLAAEAAGSSADNLTSEPLAVTRTSAENVL